MCILWFHYSNQHKCAQISYMRMDFISYLIFKLNIKYDWIATFTELKLMLSDVKPFTATINKVDVGFYMN